MTTKRQAGLSSLTTGQAADLIGISKERVVTMCADGRLPFTITAGMHRRIHIAHAKLAKEWFAVSEAMPTQADFTLALLNWSAAPPVVDQKMLARFTAVRQQVGDATWLLAAHQRQRVIDRMPPLVMTEHHDRILHAAFCRGIVSLTQFLAIELHPPSEGYDARPCDT